MMTTPRPNISFRNPWKLSNIGRTVVLSLLKVKRKYQQKFYFFCSPWLVFSEAWRWVILIKAETNDISVGAKRALHAVMVTNHQNMPRKLIIGSQPRPDSPPDITCRNKNNLHISTLTKLHVTRPFMVTANKIKVGSSGNCMVCLDMLFYLWISWNS